MRILIYDGHCFQFDNDADTDRFAENNPDAAEMTAAEIESAFGGYAQFVGPHNTTVSEDGVVTFDYTPPCAEELAAALRTERDRRIQAVAWRVERNLSETRQGVTPATDDIAALDAYVQALRDMPSVDGWPWGGPSDPAIPWPVEP